MQVDVDDGIAVRIKAHADDAVLRNLVRGAYCHALGVRVDRVPVCVHEHAFDRVLRSGGKQLLERFVVHHMEGAGFEQASFVFFCHGSGCDPFIVRQ